LALEYDDGGDDPVLTPFKEVYKLFKLALTSGLRGIRSGNPLRSIWRIARRATVQLRRRMNHITSLREEEEWILEGGH